MIYEFVKSVLVLSVVYELVELLFPSKKMNTAVKSFTLVIFLYSLCSYLPL